MSRFNKGEWAELYTLAKLLGKGCVENVSGDRRNLLKIIGVSRDSKTGPINYRISADDITLNDQKLSITPREILQLCVGLIADITKERAASGAFESESGEKLANALGIKSIKAESKSKSDIQLTIFDAFSQEERRNGYSIKLTGGNDASIVNASDHTRFTYVVRGINNQVFLRNPALLKKGAPAKIIPLIHAEGGWLELASSSSNSYMENLCFVDTAMPTILADILYQSFDCGRGRGIAKMAGKMISHAKPHNSPEPFFLHNASGPMRQITTLERKQQWLSHKLKDFLIAHATSMNPGTPWGGDIGITGGILLVDTSTGEIINNPINDLNALKQHLFENCSFDSPSTGRFDYGYVYHDKSSDTYRIDLVLAVRGQ